MDKPTLGKLKKIWSSLNDYNKWLGWTPILRGREYKRETLDVLRSNNAKKMIKDVRSWLDKAEKELI